MPRLAALLATAFVLAFAAGCGGDDDDGGGGSAATSTGAQTTRTAPTANADDYKRQVTRISTNFAQAGQTFKNSVSAQSTPQQAAGALEGFQTKVNKAADDLEGLSAPSSVGSAHKRLIAAFRGIADACQPAIDAGKDGDRARFRTALRGLQTKLNGALGNQAKQAASQIDRGLAGQ
jgi:hypothetical protein